MTFVRFGVCLCPLIMALNAADPAVLSVTSSSTTACIGQPVTLNSSSSANWDILSGSGSLSVTSGSSTTVTGKSAGTIRIQAKGDGAAQETTVTVRNCSEKEFMNQEIVRAIVGFEQLGASGTSSSQNWLFDLYTSQPVFSSRVRWWGNVKVASFPQQVNTQLVSFAQQFGSTFGSLKVNQLAESAEFLTGPEFVIKNHDNFYLTLYLAGGATGPNNPTDNVTVFTIPATTSPQYSAFVGQFGTPKSGAQYVAFLPQSDDRFMRQWQGGVRLYTHFGTGSGAVATNALGTVEFAIGQNEFVTSGHLSGLVGHVAAMHPFTFHSGSSQVTIYLFGEANTAYTRSNFLTPLPLAPALDSSQSPIPVTNPNVYTVTVPPNRRDTYRIGVGIDLMSICQALAKKSS